MKKQNLISMIDRFPKELQSIIKNIYNQVNDVRVVDWDSVEVSKEEFDKILKLMQMINAGDDITFEIGYRYFRGNKLKLKKGVFVPQFDTEQIVDLVLDKVTEGEFLEIGTGSGAIPISLVNETKMSGLTLDINPQATELAKENYEVNKKNDNSLEFLVEDFFTKEFDKKFDLIITNPPYIREDDEFVDEWVKENQPKEALYADDNGLKFYKEILNKVNSILKPNGYIILEIGFDQGEVVKELYSQISEEVEVIKDYEQHDRFVVIKYNGN